MQATDKMRELFEKMKELENEMEAELSKKQKEFFCRIDEKIEFSEEILQEQKQNIENIFNYLVTTPPLNIVTSPFVYAVAIPAILLDIFVTLYQAVCFPIYKIAKVKRKDYIIIDRQKLHYLNIIEKVHCVYCGYFNGLIAYVGEIAARTEQYLCPIKHAQKMKVMHSKYQNFFDYGDSVAYRENLTKLREALREEEVIVEK